MSEIKFTKQEQAEIITLTLTQKIARDVKGALTAKQLSAMLNISPKTVFKLAKAGRIPSFRVGSGRARRDGDAYRLVLFQVVLGALHFDVFIGCKLRADQIIRSVTGLDALAISRFKLGCPLRVGYFRSADLVQGA